MHLESGTPSSQVSLWNLPEELLLCLMKSLHIRDVLNMRAVNSFFRDMIDDCSAVWNAASFQDTWPSHQNIHYFEKAAKFGNIEALIKMAITYLYTEEMSEGRYCKNAAELFGQIEAMTPFEPFTWLFVRPPYFAFEDFTKHKHKVMIHMENHLQKSNREDTKNLNVSVAKCLLLMDVDESTRILPSLCEKKADVLLSNARRLGSRCAAFLLWQMENRSIVNYNNHHDMTDRGRKLQSIRQLREIARMGHLDSKLLLCKMYANGEYGGITPKQAAMYVRELAQSTTQSTTPATIQECFKLPTVRSIPCYQLVNSLVDIAVKKNVSGHTLYTAVSVVYRFLKCHQTPENKLELVGVSAMVLCSRFLENDCLTLVDALSEARVGGSDVIRMMGEITATLKGNIRVPNSLDFLEIFSSVAELDKKCSCLAEYVCELTLLDAEMGHHSSAEIAASSVLLARLLMKLDVSWPDTLTEFSGFTMEDLRCCVFHMHTNCVQQDRITHTGLVSLLAIKKRYAEEKFHKVSEIPTMTRKELCAKLGMLPVFDPLFLDKYRYMYCNER